MVASVNNASIRWHYSTQRPGGWPATLLAALGLERLQAKWPGEVLPLGAVVGGLTAAAAAHLGLPEGLPVAQGGAGARAREG
jgi:ribulose kinase